MTEIALGLAFGWYFAVDGVIIGQSFRRMTPEALSIVFLASFMVPVGRHQRCCALRRHEEKDQDPGADGNKKDGLEFLAHAFKLQCPTSKRKSRVQSAGCNGDKR